MSFFLHALVYALKNDWALLMFLCFKLQQSLHNCTLQYLYSFVNLVYLKEIFDCRSLSLKTKKKKKKLQKSVIVWLLVFNKTVRTECMQFYCFVFYKFLFSVFNRQ